MNNLIDCDKLLQAKIQDEVRLALRDHSTRYTSFYDPVSSSAIEKVLSASNDISFYKYGGYEGAERTVFVVYPSYMEKPDISFIGIIKISWNSKFYKLSHRDILGSIIGTGIKRDKIGDIFVIQNNAYVFTFTSLTDFLCNNLNKIGRAPVSVELISNSDLPELRPNIKTINTTVSSPRLDSIASSCFGLSRTKILQFISSGNVNVNWKCVTKPDYIIKAGDILSIRGLGKGKVKEIGSLTKKGRITVVLEKFI